MSFEICRAVKEIVFLTRIKDYKAVDNQLKRLMIELSRVNYDLKYQESYAISDLTWRLPASFSQNARDFQSITTWMSLKKTCQEMDSSVLDDLEIFAPNPSMLKEILLKYGEKEPFKVLDNVFRLRDEKDRLDVILSVIFIHPQTVLMRMGMLPPFFHPLLQSHFLRALAASLERTDLDWRGQCPLESLPLMVYAKELISSLESGKPLENLPLLLMHLKLYGKSLNLAGKVYLRRALELLAEHTLYGSSQADSLFGYAGPLLTNRAIIDSFNPRDEYAFEMLESVQVDDELLEPFLVAMSEHMPEETLEKVEEVQSERAAVRVLRAVSNFHPILALEQPDWELFELEAQVDYNLLFNNLESLPFDSLYDLLDHMPERVLKQMNVFFALSEKECIDLAEKAFLKAPESFFTHFQKFGTFKDPECETAFNWLVLKAFAKDIENEGDAISLYNFPFSDFHFKDVAMVYFFIDLASSFPTSEKLWFLSGISMSEELRQEVLDISFGYRDFARDPLVLPTQLVENGYGDHARLGKGVCYGISLGCIGRPLDLLTHVEISKTARFYQAWMDVHNKIPHPAVTNVLVTLLQYRQGKATNAIKESEYRLAAEHWEQEQEVIATMSPKTQAKEKSAAYQLVKNHLFELKKATVVDPEGRHVLAASEVARGPKQLLKKLGLAYTHRGDYYQINQLESPDEVEAILDEADKAGPNIGCILVMQGTGDYAHAIFIDPKALCLVDQNCVDEENNPLVTRFSSRRSFFEGLFYFLAVRSSEYSHFQVDAFKRS